MTGGRPALTRTLLRCGCVAGPLFVTTFLVEGARRADYDPLRHPVSSLALGPRGWVQVANFSVAGTLYLAETVGLRGSGPAGGNRIGRALLGGAALGLLGSAAFRTDPVSGYPPGTPAVHATYSTAGALHDLSGVPVFLGLPAAAVAYGWSFRRGGRPSLAAYSVGSAAVMVASFGLASAGFAQVPALVEVGGLFQRVFVVTGFGWLTALAGSALRTLPAP